MDDGSDHLRRIRRQFTRQADAYAALPQTQDPAPLDGLVSLVGVQPSHRVLDVACGAGFLTLAFARRCASAVGVDATPALLERAREEAAHHGIANVRFEAGDATALGFGDAAFEVASCRAAFHHFPRPDRVLAEMRRVVAPEGRLLIADLLGSEDPERAARHDAIERLCDPTHVRALPLSDFERLFATAGLVVERRTSGRMSYDVEAWMAHGGPSPEVAAEIVRRFEDALAGDRCDLDVHRRDGRLRFRHRVAAFVLRPAAAGPVSR